MMHQFFSYQEQVYYMKIIKRFTKFSYSKINIEKIGNHLYPKSFKFFTVLKISNLKMSHF